MNTPARPAQIVVVGACNTDLVSYVPRLPALGETLHGVRFQAGFGGKGANQAVMAAKLGARVTMIGKLGRDVFGADYRAHLAALGINTDHVHMTDAASSGVAPIAVDAEGRNAIIIVMGANDLLTRDEIDATRAVISAADVVVGQLEIPLDITMAVLRMARHAGVRTILNPAPAKPSLPDECYALSDIFCPNENETALLTGMPVDTLTACERAGRELVRRGAGTVILTLGARGSLIVTADDALHVAARAVHAVDSTGAGDAFVGSLACFLGEGMALAAAVRAAGAIATLSVLKPGAQSSFPTRAEAREFCMS